MSSRLDVRNGRILDTKKNREILSNSSNKENITKSETIEKLANYRVVEDNTKTSNKWHRYININDGRLRGGGFIIKNDPSQPFIAFKNVSLDFTFSAQRDDIILFENKGRDTLSDDLRKILTKYSKMTSNLKENIILIEPPFERVLSARTFAELTREVGFGKNTLSRALKSGRDRVKGSMLFRLNNNEQIELERDLADADTETQTDLVEIKQIIDLFFD